MLNADSNTNKPSMVGDVDDVANLVTPSPRNRNPSKMQVSLNEADKPRQVKDVTTELDSAIVEDDNQDDENLLVREEATTVKHSAKL